LSSHHESIPSLFFYLFFMLGTTLLNLLNCLSLLLILFYLFFLSFISCSATCLYIYIYIWYAIRSITATGCSDYLYLLFRSLHFCSLIVSTFRCTQYYDSSSFLAWFVSRIAGYFFNIPSLYITNRHTRMISW